MFRLAPPARDGVGRARARVCRELGAGDTPDPVGPEETRHGSLMLPAKGRGPGRNGPGPRDRPQQQPGGQQSGGQHGSVRGDIERITSSVGIDGGRYVGTSIDACQYDGEAAPRDRRPLRAAVVRRSEEPTPRRSPTPSRPGRPGAAAPPEPDRVLSRRGVPGATSRSGRPLPAHGEPPPRGAVRAGLERERRGKWVYFRVRPEPLASLRSILSPDPSAPTRAAGPDGRSRRGSDARPVACRRKVRRLPVLVPDPGEDGQASPHPIVITTSLVRTTSGSATWSARPRGRSRPRPSPRRRRGSADQPARPADAPEPARPSVARATPPRSGSSPRCGRTRRGPPGSPSGRALHRSTR